MSKAERIVIWLTAVGVLIAALSLALYAHHEEEHGDISMWVIGVSLLFLIGWAVTGWAVYRNVKDAHRATHLEGQIVAIKDEVAALEKERDEAREWNQTFKNELVAKDSEFAIRLKEKESEWSKKYVPPVLKRESFTVSVNGFPVAGIGPESETEGISPDDPRMTIEVQAGKEKGLSPTVSIKVRNVGNSELQKLRLQNMMIAGAMVRFDENIPSIAPTTSSDCMYPIIDGVGTLQRHNLAGQMMKDWEHQGGLKVETLTFPAKAIYEDYCGTKYIAEWEYEFFPHKFRSCQNHDDKSVIPETSGPYLIVKALTTQKFKKA